MLLFFFMSECSFNIDSDVTYRVLISEHVISCVIHSVSCLSYYMFYSRLSAALWRFSSNNNFIGLTQFGPRFSCGTDVLMMVYRGADGPLSDCEGPKPSPCADAWCEVSVLMCLVFCFMDRHLRPKLCKPQLCCHREEVFSCNTSKAAIVVQSFLSVLS